MCSEEEEYSYEYNTHTSTNVLIRVQTRTYKNNDVNPNWAFRGLFCTGGGGAQSAPLEISGTTVTMNLKLFMCIVHLPKNNFEKK